MVVLKSGKTLELNRFFTLTGNSHIHSNRTNYLNTFPAITARIIFCVVTRACGQKNSRKIYGV